MTRSYNGFWAAANEEAVSRVYGGIHFTFDSVAGQEIGADVGGYVVDNFLEPRDRPSSLSAGNLGAGSSNAFFANRDDGRRDSGDREDEDSGHRSILL